MASRHRVSNRCQRHGVAARLTQGLGLASTLLVCASSAVRAQQPMAATPETEIGRAHV